MCRQGFIAPPFKLLHLDSIRIYNSRIRGAVRAAQREFVLWRKRLAANQRNERRNCTLNAAQGRSKTQTPFGLSLLIGGAAFLYARDQARPPKAPGL